jgi:hypothetical protein
MTSGHHTIPKSLNPNYEDLTNHYLIILELLFNY